MVTQVQQDQKDRIKNNIKDSHDYFRENYQNYVNDRNFVFRSSISKDEESLLEATKKPVLEVNMSEAYISRLYGEFSKQEPSLEVRSSDDAINVDTQLIDVVEGHTRSILYDANKDGLESNCYKEVLSGGFSAFKVITDYPHPMSFDQCMKIKKIYDPTLVGFDRLAQDSHKGDGQYCFEYFPREKTDFEREYGTKYTKDMRFLSKASSFQWSYKSGEKEILLLADYYEKEIQKKKIVRLIDGQVMTEEDYEKFLANWNADSMNLMPAPGVLGKPRTTEIVTIARYLLVENDIIKKEPTDYTFLPIIFVDGNSVVLRESMDGAATQFTRSYLYHAKGMQRLINFSAINLANEMQNQVQHKWMMPIEGVIPAQKDALINNQIPAIVLYKQYKDNDPNMPINPPQAVPRVPAPPEIMQVFQAGPSAMQMILGSYDAALGINNNQLSGIAIQEGATQSNATAMPYVVNFMKALNRAGEIILDLIPKYYLSQRNLPVRTLGGETSYQMVNAPGKPQMNYKPNSLQIKIEAGVNFEIQKSRALDALIRIMQVNPLFAQFMAKKKGLFALLDNIDIRGIDAIKEEVEKFCDEMEQQQQMQQKMAMENNPAALKRMEIQQKSQQGQMDYEAKAASIAVQNRKVDVDEVLAANTITTSQSDQLLKAAKVDAENARTAVDSMVKHADTRHNHAMDMMDLHHKHKAIESKSDRKGAEK